jgi:hypothetical protein
MEAQLQRKELELVEEIKALRLMLEDEDERLTLGQTKHLLLRLERAEEHLRELKEITKGKHK